MYRLMCMLLVLLSSTLSHARHTHNSPHDHTNLESKLTDIKQVTGGRIQGFIDYDSTVESYLGIPFAEPPTGINRFKLPRTDVEWSGIKKTVSAPSACPQLRVSDSLFYGNEDCLYLNVYTPHVKAESDGEKLPVLVFFYGGAYILGDSYSLGLYNGAELVKQQNIIVVTMNYRLGSLGFLSLDELGEESDNTVGSVGNQGMHDQIAALQWIQKNIHLFNGDAARVTISGESAGAFSVCFHLASPLSEGLFSAAIMQSGSCDAVSFFLDKDESIAHSHSIAKHVGCDQTGDELLHCLRQVEVGRLIDYSAAPSSSAPQRMQIMKSKHKAAANFTPLHSRLTFDSIVPWMTANPVTRMFGPTIDNVALTDIPLAVIKSGKFNAVPTLAGYNRDEGSMFVRRISDVLPSANSPITEADLRAALLELVVHNETAVDTILKTYPLSEYDTPQAQASAIITDYFFGCEQRRALHAISSNSDVSTYSYHFTYSLSFAEAKYLGTYHGSELVFLFDYSVPVIHSFNKHDEHVAHLFGGYWGNFVKTHNPNKPLPLNNEVEWPEFTADASDNIALDIPTSVQRNYNADRCAMWDDISQLR